MGQPLEMGASDAPIGAPASDAADPGDQASDESTEDDGQAAKDGEGGAVSCRTLAAGGLGVIALGCVAVAVALLRSRRA